MKILLTGFEAFGSYEVNPTEILANRFNKLLIRKNISIVGEIIPLKYQMIKPTLKRLVKENNPIAILLTGQGGGNLIRLEKFAKNYVKNDIPYNCGTIIEGRKIEASGPDILKSTISIKKIRESIMQKNIPVTFSESAGTFGCNKIFYHCLFEYPKIPSGFIHVPILPVQAKVNQSSMTQTLINQAVKIALHEISNYVINNSSNMVQNTI